MQIIDSHSHIDFDDFNEDRPSVIQGALNIGVSDIIISATTAVRWNNIKSICDSFPNCHAAYGLHPMFMNEHNLESSNHDLDQLESWLQTNKVVAIGEIGLDFFIQDADAANRKAQEALFVSQCEIASKFKLPVIIHARKSLDIILKHIRRFPHLKGVIHSFSGSEQQAKQLIDLGFYLSFGGAITYDRATRLHKLIKMIPLDALLVETDSPDQPDSLHHSERNEPAYIINVIDKIAELKGVDKEVIADETTRNAIELYYLRPT